MKRVGQSACLSPEAERLAECVLSEPWEYVDADTQHLTHNLHRYSGKFIPQIAARAISLLTKPGELVVDPYCGSGTTLLESALLGRKALGIDLNPLAVLITAAKITPVAEEKLQAMQRFVCDVLSNIETSHEPSLFRASAAGRDIMNDVKQDLRRDDPWFTKWFQPPILDDLLAIDHAIARIRGRSQKIVARVALSDILRKSSNAHSGYPNVMFNKRAPERSRPLRPFLKALGRTCEMVASLGRSNGDWSQVRVEQGNAAELPLESCSVDAVISHPPYIGSVPYAEYGLLSLKWLGVDPKALDRQLTGGRRQSSDVVSRFRNDYDSMLREASRVLRPSRYIFLMVGNPVVKGEKIDLAKMSLELAKAIGLRLVARTTRTGGNRRANKMGEEHLLFFQKSASRDDFVKRPGDSGRVSGLQVGSRQ